MAAEHIRHWRVGDVEIARIVEVYGFEDDISMLLPGATPRYVQQFGWLLPHFATPDGRMIISFQCFVLRSRGRTAMIDTCIGNDRRREFEVFCNMQNTFLEDLGSAGFPHQQVTDVLCTHLHFDHVGWNTRLVGGEWLPTFKNARYVFGKDEYAYWRDHSIEPDKAAIFADSVAPVVEAGQTDLVAGDARICEEITLIPTPGHSPGHMSLHIRSDGEEGLITGDVAHHPCQMAHLDWSSTADSDPAQSPATRRELFSRFADTPTLVIGGHFDAGHIKLDGEAFKFIALG